MININLFDHCCGLRDHVAVDLPREIVVERLRRAIPEPQFDIGDEDQFTVHARVDRDTIQIHVNGFPASMVAGGWLELLATLTREVTA